MLYETKVSDPSTAVPAVRPLGVALLGHGSGRGCCTDEGLRALTARLAARLGAAAAVRVAFFEFLHPTLAETLQDLQAAGVAEVVVMPYFLFDGKEIQLEIPNLLRELAPRYPSLRLVQAPNLGVDDRLIELVTERVQDALRGLGQHLPVGGRLPRLGESGPLGVVLVNRGSRARYDDGARLRTLADRLSARLGAPVEPAQAENSRELTIETAADRLVAAGAARIVVAPYLHFPGKVLVVNVIPALERAAARHPDRRFYLASTICVDERLAAICADRIAQAREEHYAR